ncbi:MAG: permease [Acidobacteria bacterium]|jgi:hypothetical protein|nr:permease [Acidobacteriota bacterium]
MSERWKLILLVGAFLLAFFLPIETPRVQGALLEGFFLLKDYAREHVLLCLVPAFFIAGAIGQFLSQGAVLRYLGAKAPRPVAYGVASVSGSILAVCSCTVLPLFASIYRRGAGLGPATAFLYSGPAINVLALILTARVLGVEIGLARAIGAVVFAVVVGLLMAFLFRREEAERQGQGADPFAAAAAEVGPRQGWQDALFLATMVGILVFANWGAPNREVGAFAAIHSVRWWLTGALALALAVMMVRWYTGDELRGWVDASWGFAKQITPLLLGGILISGWLMGRPGTDAGLVPSSWIADAVGGNAWAANLLASVVGSFMYFATLTEVPILQTLLGAGMGPGPALALLLAGPALSLPNMIVIRSYLGTRKTAAYVALVVVMATVSGWAYGVIAGLRVS